MQLDRVIYLLNNTLVSSRQRELTALEILIIEAIWSDRPYQQISANYEYTTVRNTASKLLKDIAAAVQKPVSKKNCKSILLELQSNNTSTIDLAAAPTEILPFCGRTTEIDQVSHWILTDRAKLVGLMGIGGIGKTAIAARLATALSDQFEFVIWRSLREAPPATTLITELVQFLSQYTEIELPEQTDRQIQRLLYHLRQHRCLVILDNIESIMTGGTLAGNYRSGYETYGDLLLKLGTTPHQSCLLLTSREAPPELIELTAPTSPVRSLFLNGIVNEAPQLLNNLGLTGSKIQIAAITEQCQGNPLYLRIIANTILNYFGGSIPEFLQTDRLNYSKITNVLQAQFDRLSLDEKLVIYHLAVHREPIGLDILVTQIRSTQTSRQLQKTLESLDWRSLLQTTRENRYTLQNVVMEFMTTALIQTIAAELQNLESPFFLTV